VIRAASSEARNSAVRAIRGAGLPIRHDLSLYRLVSAAGENYQHPIPAGHGAFLFILEGAAEINRRSLARRDSIGLAEIDRMEIAAGENGADLLLVDTAL
jgi:redox-sensitive bicupin YhaK (pirin superfamily)